MKSFAACLLSLCLAPFVLRASSAPLYVDANGTNPTAPYAGWSTAATNIQDAIDASTDGDQIWVTNGIYQTGGKVMAGDLTNRIALDKSVTVQSVNGPWVTVIQGAGAINGTAAVRCAWLTNGASLAGFTLRDGATRTSGDSITLASGGGTWCASSNAMVRNCVFVSNTATRCGGGTFQGTLNNCLISSNGVSFPFPSGAAAYAANLNNCTVVSNACSGTCLGLLTNCIVYYNSASYSNFAGGSLSYCCTFPLPSGPGNFTNSPQLFADGVHLAKTSPCIGAGAPVATGSDIFGYDWNNPPSIGCTESAGAPLVTKPQIQLTGDPVGFAASSIIAVQSPFLCWWLKDGVPLQDNGHFSSTQTTNLVAIGVSFADAGGYQLVLSNAFGVVTSAVAPLVIHCVDVAGTNPIAPYTAWETAATNIQDAITAAAAGDIVLVTNGLYATGGKSMDHVITNRMSVDKAILVQGVNGPNATIIQGAWDPASTNGPGAVRCAWLTNNAILSGFTLRGGATPKSGAAPNQYLNGGGVWGAATSTPPNVTVANCVILHNAAANCGGGAYAVALHDCFLATNIATGGGSASGSGGGAYGCDLRNCLVTSNAACYPNGSGGGANTCNLKNCAVIKNISGNNGGGAERCTLINCTLTGNLLSYSFSGNGGGVDNSSLTNCIVYANFGNTTPGASNSYLCAFSYSCTAPAASGTGNIASDPLLLADGVHLSAASPCRAAGTGTTASTDIDGQPWNNPPAIGCDEWQPAPVIGAPPAYQVGLPARGLTFNIIVAGQSPFTCFWTKDGTRLQDDGHYSNSGTINLAVSSFGPDDAGVYQVVVSNAFGVVTSQVAQVVIHAADAAGANPVPPYSTWATAATSIQDAIDAAAAGDIVLVTNGVYATGGKIMVGDLVNRVALDKAVTVTSVNGYETTVIEGAWDPVATNGVGTGAIRCAYVADGALLSGFMLRNGATRPASGSLGGPLESGGGAWCTSSNGIVSNCVLTNNAAGYGGGIIHGTLNNSLVVHNLATSGGGAYYALLNNCTVVNNYLTGLNAIGAGTCGGITRNSIVMYNYANWPLLSVANNFFICDPYFNSCSYPYPLGPGNITNNPQFLDGFHIASASPCRCAGSATYATGTDLDGESWANPPSMGCDEVVVSNLVGPLSVNLQANQDNPAANLPAGFWGTVTGHATYVAWSFGDGLTFTNLGAGTSYQWPKAGDYLVTFTAYNADNPDGVSTNLVVHVLVTAPFPLQSLALWTNQFRFSFIAQPNVSYTIQVATNCEPPVAWRSVWTVSYSNLTPIEFRFPRTADSLLLYRVMAQ